MIKFFCDKCGRHLIDGTTADTRTAEVQSAERFKPWRVMFKIDAVNGPMPHLCPECLDDIIDQGHKNLVQNRLPVVSEEIS